MTKKVKSVLLTLILGAILIILPAVSLAANIALNPSRIGYPSPLESDNGWGGGADTWDIIDGITAYGSEWWNGLAFTGGTYGYGPCGWRQATINFGEPKSFNRVVVWHAGMEHAPNTYKIQYWDGINWVDVFSTTDGHAYLTLPEAYTENTFPSVTSSKVRFALNNCDIVHGWIYEFDVYGSPVNQPPVANAGGPYVGNEGSPITFDGSGSSDPDGTIVSYEWDLDGDGLYDDATGVNPSYTWGDDYFGSIGLKVTDNGGLTATATTTVNVLNVPPIVEAGTNQEVFAGDTVQFNGSFTDPGSDTYTITWNFGDGSPASGTLIPTHVYSNKGICTVTLTVTDDDGGIGNDILKVTVKPIPATIRIEPETLNFSSKGVFTAFITFSEGYDVANINLSTVVCEGALAVKGIVSEEDKGTYIVKFNRQNVVNVPIGGAVTLTVTGKVGLADFEGNDTVNIIVPTLKKEVLPKDYVLSQNSPNPFNPITTIQYVIPAGKSGMVRLTIYDSRGSLVRTLVDGVQNPGIHTATWNATDDSGRRISSGIYIYRLEVGSFTQTRKMLFLR